MGKKPSKILPNNGPLAEAYRRGVTTEFAQQTAKAVDDLHRDAVRQASDRMLQLVLSKHQQNYTNWLHVTFEGEPCQCPLLCGRLCEQAHHEPGGHGKDDRAQVMLSRECHEARTEERGHGDLSPKQYRYALRARAFDNWLTWLEQLRG